MFMHDAVHVLRAAAVSGSCASVASLLALAWGGANDAASALAPVNAVSHWIWKERAIHQQDGSLRYTLPGYVIHHSMSVFWAVSYEALAARQARRRSFGTWATLATGLGVAALACLVDLRLTPERLTPGFERRLRPGSLFFVYLLFGLGLTLPRWVAARRRDEAHPFPGHH